MPVDRPSVHHRSLGDVGDRHLVQASLAHQRSEGVPECLARADHADGGVALYALLALTALTFVLLQSAVLNWLGFAGWPLLVILWLFGPSVLAVPPEFLATGYRTWIYSWIPFRYTFEALQGLLFFDAGAGETARNVWIVGLYGLIALAAVLGSTRRLHARDLTVHPLARRFRGAPAQP